MKQALQKIFSLFRKTNPARKEKARKTKGQSMVEVAIALPVLIMLLSGMVEFGFILNYYLSLLDATREAARVYSGGDPFTDTAGTIDKESFYLDAALATRNSLNPSFTYANPADYKGRRIVLDPAVDDVIVSVYRATLTTVILCRDLGVYHLYPAPGLLPGNDSSLFTQATILNTRVAGAPNAGLLVVEVHHTYHQVLGLPWMKPFDPIRLRAYTIMPIRAAESPACP